MIYHKELENGFKYLEVQNSQAHAKIALQGAHIFHYQTNNQLPLLWLSDLSYFEEQKAIRGGIPICFPWFGKNKNDATLPQHGFARTQIWKLVLEEEVDEGTSHIQLQLLPNETTKRLWDYHFDARLDFVISKELTITLTVTNTDTKAFEITTALHTYLNVLEISKVRVQGLEHSMYHNSLDGKRYVQKGDVSIDEEVDRVYFDGAPKIKLVDTHRTIELNQEGSNSLIVWNPWIEKSSQMADMSPEGYKTMLCLETANALEDSKHIEPKASHVLKVVLS